LHDFPEKIIIMAQYIVVGLEFGVVLLVGLAIYMIRKK
jgi:hypothetical protein